eukprot:7083118-Pyramimonas_sp.AAC.2
MRRILPYSSSGCRFPQGEGVTLDEALAHAAMRYGKMNVTVHAMMTNYGEVRPTLVVLCSVGFALHLSSIVITTR